MDAASGDEFQNLSVTTPCCGQKSSLNALQYKQPCGFACVEFDVFDPAADICDDILSAVGGMLGSPVRVIHAHL